MVGRLQDAHREIKGRKELYEIIIQQQEQHLIKGVFEEWKQKDVGFAEEFVEIDWSKVSIVNFRDTKIKDGEDAGLFMQNMGQRQEMSARDVLVPFSCIWNK